MKTNQNRNAYQTLEKKLFRRGAGSSKNNLASSFRDGVRRNNSRINEPGWGNESLRDPNPFGQGLQNEAGGMSGSQSPTTTLEVQFHSEFDGLELFDGAGKSLKKVSGLSGSSTSMSIGSLKLSPGTYFLKSTMGGTQVSTMKIEIATDTQTINVSLGFAFDELMAEAYQYNTIKSLHTKLDPQNTGWSVAPKTSGHSVTYGGDVKQVQINTRQSLSKGVRDLAWEMTNAIYEPRRQKDVEAAKKGEITKKDFVLNINRQEAEAQLNAMLVTKEMGQKIQDAWDASSTSLFAQFESGSLSRKDFIEKVALLHYNNGKIDTGDGNGLRPARDVYGEQYDKLKDKK